MQAAFDISSPIVCVLIAASLAATCPVIVTASMNTTIRGHTFDIYGYKKLVMVRYLARSQSIYNLTVVNLNNARYLRNHGGERKKVDELTAAQREDYDTVVVHLKNYYEGPHLRIMTRRALAGCKQEAGAGRSRRQSAQHISCPPTPHRAAELCRLRRNLNELHQSPGPATSPQCNALSPYYHAIHVHRLRVNGFTRAQQIAYNDTEARVCWNLIERLLAKGIASDALCIITFYREQLKRLGKMARRLNVEVITVHSIQGRERDIVILLTTRTEVDQSTTESFDDYQRMMLQHLAAVKGSSVHSRKRPESPVGATLA
ncbi:unnamed protein product [Cylicocyclus nassatus]|uniref:DNA2/NAM7 helicase-like C-terminal domain-containing protein n=1 Tax=Cylicocyclus nassatus TaxID=53992 RepID=A0AA36H991_CYLNA|nr:unnamed protein product [Cylicocyclus nassatus]